MAANYIENQVKDQFKNRETFTREELLAFYRTYNPEISDGTFGWKIFDLKKKHLIESVKRGVYTLVNKRNFKPELDVTILAIAGIMQNAFVHHSYNIWNTAWLNEFTELQTTSSLIILETDRDSMERMFFLLKDKQLKVYFKPDENVIEKYISEDREAIIIKPMITRAPVNTISKVVIPSLEKMLVDLFCDGKIFYAYQGKQLVRIFESAFGKYMINLSRMLNYAKRRKREKELKDFLIKNLPGNLKTLIE